MALYQLWNSKQQSEDHIKNTVSKKNPMAVRFGNNLHTLRTINGETIEQLSELMMLKKHLIILYENGLKIPSLPLIEEISNYYDVTVDAIMHSDPATIKKSIMRKRYPNPIKRAIKKLFAMP